MDSLIASLGRPREAMLDRPPLELQLKEVHGTINPRWPVTQQMQGLEAGEFDPKALRQSLNARLLQYLP